MAVLKYEIPTDLVSLNFRPNHSPLNIERMVEDTGYVPRFDLNSAFDDYASWIARFSLPSR